MQMLLFGAVVGAILGIVEFLLYQKKRILPDVLLLIVKNFIIYNSLSVFIMSRFMKAADVFHLSFDKKNSDEFMMYVLITLISGLAGIFIKCLMDGKIKCEKETGKMTKKEITGKAALVVLLTLGVAAFTATDWSYHTFGSVRPDQFLVNLKSPVAGTNPTIIKSAFRGPVFESFFAGLVFSLFVFSRRKFTLSSPQPKEGRKKIPVRRIVSAVLALVIFVSGCTFGIKSFELQTIISAYMSDNGYFEKNYVSPNDVKMTFPQKQKNLIHIYLESVENTYLNKELGGAMNTNLMPELTALAEEGVVFSHNSDKFGGPHQTTGSGWSVAAMVNMETGSSLKIPMGGASYGVSDFFIPGAVALGDILEARGYEQTLMFGANSDFGGLTTYFKTHGNFNIIDYKAAKGNGLIPNNYKVFWGYEDDKLYEFAKNEILRMHSTGKPFHFEMETADTHSPEGYLSPKADRRFPSQYENAIAYSTKQAVEFVRWIQQQDFYKDTVIVITGDHRSMNTSLFDKYVDKDYERTVFNLFLNTGIDCKCAANRDYAPFDFFPTIISGMGIDIEGERLGLGTNLFSGEKTLVERDGLKTVDKWLYKKSDYYNEKISARDNSSVYLNK